MRQTVFALALAVTLAAVSSASPARDPFSGPECIDFADGYELYGVTDVNGALGHGRLSIGVNQEGTISVLKWPNPSFYDQIKYFTVDREENYQDDQWDLYARHDVNFGVLENEGAFAGLVLRLRNERTEVHWLRQYSRGWRIAQRYASHDSDTLVTTWRNARLRLTVTGIDVVPALPGSPQKDVLVRRYVVHAGPGSPVVSARIVAFANMNPVASKSPWLPGYDWCQEGADNDVRQTTYDAAHDAVVWTIRGTDAGAASIAMGLRGASVARQVGVDGLDPWSPGGGVPGAPQDAYLDAADGTLSGNDAVPGPATAALAGRLDLSTGRATADVIFGFGAEPADAHDALAAARTASFGDLARSSADFWKAFLSTASLPDLSADPSIPPAERLTLIETAKRSLIALRMMVADSGAITASHTTQPPYGQDWIRDGAFFNHALEVAGHPEMVRRHDLFYATVQTGSPTKPGPMLPRPPGNWAMTYYADGIESGPLPWEIDETGLGAWTLWEHYEWMTRVFRDPEALDYLKDVFPAIGRAADWLTACRDPRSDLLCPGYEDDEPGEPFTQGRQGAITAVMALRAAVRAGTLMRDDRVPRWEERLRALIAAIDRPEADGGFRTGRDWGGGYQVGGWFIWPGRYRPYADPAMRSQARRVVAEVQERIDAPEPIGSQYEGKGTLAAAIFATETGDGPLLARVRRQIRWLGTYVPTRDTHLFGEHYYNVCTVRAGARGCPRGRMRSVPSTSLPHAWQHTLFYLSSVYAWGRAPYAFAGPAATRDPAGGSLAP